MTQNLIHMNLKDKLEYFFGVKYTEQAILCNKLLSTFQRPTRYLEIGVDEGVTFRKIVSDVKEGVDPYGRYDVAYRMTSQMFFALNKLFFHKKYDLIFIDSSHISNIVDYEIRESLRILNRGGYIVLHDTDPSEKQFAELVLSDILSYLRSISYPYNSSHTDALNRQTFNGDVWKSVAKIRMNNPRLEVFTVADFGCTVIKRGEQKRLMRRVPDDKLSWNYFETHRKEILNLIPFTSINRYLY